MTEPLLTLAPPPAVLWPMLLTLMGAMAVLMLTVSGPAFTPHSRSTCHLTAIALLSLVGAMLALLFGAQGPAFSGSIALDGIGQTLGCVVCLGSALSLIMAMAYLEEHELAVGEYVALVLFATVGGLAVTCAQDLLVLFLGIELMSIAAYVLAGFRRAQRRSQEAALKYFFYGAFASAVMVFGMAILWGEIGLAQGEPSLRFEALSQAATAGSHAFAPMAWVGVALFLAGLSFKVAAAPFHMWAPDVYEGAPTPSAAFLSVVVKVAAVSALCRFLAAIFAQGHRDVETATQVIELLAICSMVAGNLLALRQNQIKRMLAYSSIAHIGYVLVGLSALPQGRPGQAIAHVAFYLTGYAAAAIGAFAVVSAFERRDDRRVDLHLDRLSGAVRQQPALACAMAIFMFALAGIPPTAGFIGKVGLFSAALGAGRITLTLVAALASVVGACYYLRVLSVMFMGEGKEQAKAVSNPWLTACLWLCASITLALGLAPNLWLSYAREALRGFVG